MWGGRGLESQEGGGSSGSRGRGRGRRRGGGNWSGLGLAWAWQFSDLQVPPVYSSPKQRFVSLLPCAVRMEEMTVTLTFALPPPPGRSRA